MKNNEWFFCRKQTLFASTIIFIASYCVMIALLYRIDEYAQSWVRLYLWLIPWIFPAIFLFDNSVYSIVRCDDEGITASRFGVQIWHFLWSDVENVAFGTGNYRTNAFFFTYRQNNETKVVQVEYSKKAKEVILRSCVGKSWISEIEASTLWGQKRQ